MSGLKLKVGDVVEVSSILKNGETALGIVTYFENKDVYINWISPVKGWTWRHKHGHVFFGRDFVRLHFKVVAEAEP